MIIVDKQYLVTMMATILDHFCLLYTITHTSFKTTFCFHILFHIYVYICIHSHFTYAGTEVQRKLSDFTKTTQLTNKDLTLNF